MTTTSARRSAAALLGAGLALVALGAPARAAGTPGTTGTDTKTSAAPAGAATWSVQPSSAKGPGTRAHFVYDLAPGATVTDYVGITNLSARPLTLKLYASDAFNTASGGFDLLPAATSPTDVGSWVTAEKTEVTVPARRRVDVPFTLKVPADATPGDHVGGMVASLSVKRTTADGRQLDVDNRVGSRIYLRVDGPLRPQATVTQLETGYTGTANPAGRGQVGVAYTVRNTGNTRLSGRITATIDGPFGLKLATVDLGALPELLPGNAFNGTTTVGKVAPAGRLGTDLTVAPVIVTGEPGTESATAGMSLPQVTRASGAWAVPWTLFGVVVLVLGLGYARFRRRAHPGGDGGTGRTRPDDRSDDGPDTAGPDESTDVSTADSTVLPTDAHEAGASSEPAHS